VNVASPPAAGRILALDLGERRIGLAISDELGLTAQGLDSLTRTTEREDLDRLARLVEEKQVAVIVVGNPIRMDGTEGVRSEWAGRFARKLGRRTRRSVVLWDERLTTKAAERVLRASGVSRAKRDRAVDRLSAVLLLSSYLETLSRLPRAAGSP
jgi:putative Holliday junction resolvase